MSLKINNRFNYLNIEAQMSEQPATLSRAKQIGKALRNNHGPLSLTCVCVPTEAQAIQGSQFYHPN